MNELGQLLQDSIGLIGVIIGGVISYIAQTKHQQKIEERKDKRQKLIAYNKFLLLDGEKTPMKHWETVGFDWERYVESTRKILYENLHLFDKKIVENVLMMDSVAERVKVMGLEQHDLEETFQLYLEIRNAIEEDYKRNIRA